jgi:NAD(P)H dehydrogenase (quinone)
MIAICGATGKLGGTAARRLRERGLPVTAVVRDASKADDLHKLGCRIAIADLFDKASLKAALNGAEQVLAICPVLPKAADVMADSKRMIASIVSALASARPQRVLAISDYGAHVTGDTGITTIFRLFEQQLLAAGPNLTVLRSAEHMQNWFRQLIAARERGVLPSLHHPVARRFPTVSAFDVGELAAELLRSPTSAPGKSVIHVEGPARYCAEDVAQAFAHKLGREVVAQEVPRADWESALVAAGLTRSYAQLVAALQDAHNAGLIEVEPGGEVRKLGTDLASALSSLPGYSGGRLD